MNIKNSSREEVQVDPKEKVKVFFNADAREIEIDRFIKFNAVTYVSHSEAHNWQGADHVVIIKYKVKA